MSGEMIYTDNEIDDLAQRITSVIEQASLEDLLDSDEVKDILHLTEAGHAKRLLQLVDSASTKFERDEGKIDVVKALLLSTWHQRLYFVIRSFLMGVLGSALTFSFILFFGSINLTLGIILSVFGFLFTLMVSRLFDDQITKLTRKTIRFLGSHRGMRAFIIDHF
jgi:hypothetical protein